MNDRQYGKHLKFFFLATFWIMFFLFGSCGDYEFDNSYCFVGDSEIARWDLQVYFPDLITKNLGKKSTGLDYIQELKGSLRGHSAIIQFGTNDYRRFDSLYADRYVDAIANLDSKNVYVISMFPRHFKTDKDDCNSIIYDMNCEIKKKVQKKGWKYIDVFSMLLKDGDINKDFFSDGLHLSASGYEMISSELRKTL